MFYETSRGAVRRKRYIPTCDELWLYAPRPIKLLLAIAIVALFTIIGIADIAI